MVRDLAGDSARDRVALRVSELPSATVAEGTAESVTVGRSTTVTATLSIARPDG